MSEKYEPKRGDRVRVVIEGEVSCAPGRSAAVACGAPGDLLVWVPLSNSGVSIERLPDPLPTTPGSVVRDRGGDLWMRGLKRWILATAVDGYLAQWDEERLAAKCAPLTVLFDAGKDSTKD